MLIARKVANAGKRKQIRITCNAKFTYLFIYFSALSANFHEHLNMCVYSLCRICARVCKHYICLRKRKEVLSWLKNHWHLHTGMKYLINFIWKIQLIDLMIWRCIKKHTGAAQLYVITYIYAQNLDKSKLSSCDLCTISFRWVRTLDPFAVLKMQNCAALSQRHTVCELMGWWMSKKKKKIT